MDKSSRPNSDTSTVTTSSIATPLLAVEDRLRDLVKDLCASVQLPPPENLNVNNWMQLCNALRHESSLRSVLPSTLTELVWYDYNRPPTDSRTTTPPAEDATVAEIFEHAFQAMTQDIQNAGLQHGQQESHEEVISPVEWYSARHRQAASLLRWLDTEAGPIVAALAAAEHQSRPAYAMLEIPQLQERLHYVVQAYAAEMDKLRMREATKCRTATK